MFLSKLSVSLARRCALQNLTKLPKCLHSNDKGKLCPKPEIVTSVGAESRCEKHNESLGNCPRTQAKSDCKTGGAADSRTQAACGRHAAEAFSDALGKVRNDALTLQIFTRNSVNAIATSMDLENASRLKAERSRAIERLRGVVNKVDEINKMSFRCGSKKRNKCYAIHEQFFASLKVWERENVAGEESVKRRLEELECTVKERTDTAVAIVRTCKGCANPDNLMICVESSLRDAECIINMTDEHARSEISSVEHMKTLILQENENALRQLVGAFDRAVVAFETELDTCTKELKKLQKR